MSALPPDSIAIVGLSIRAPGATDAASFFANLRAGVDSISRFTRAEQLERGVPREIVDDPRYVAAGGVLDGIEYFDAGFFGLSAREAELTDPQQRIFLELVWHALEDAGVDPGAADRVVGLFAGCSMSRYLLLHAAPQTDAVGSVTNLLALVGNDKDHIATRTAYLLNLRGPCVNVQTSCSTSLVAVHLACQSLLARECDCAVAGAASIQLPQGHGYFHEPGGITSADGVCRPFDAAAGGTVFGSGAGAVVLKRAEDAVRDGDRIYALIRGSSIYNDGARKAGYSAPAHDGQVRAAATALAVAGVDAAGIDYVECHGTGTALGDPIEIAALWEAFGGGSAWIGSAKANVGHLECASGIVGLIKTALAFHEEWLPASLHFESGNPRIAFEGFRVLTEGRAWTRGSRLRRACVHSLGIGGTNAHVVLEEGPTTPTAARGETVLCLSARDSLALRAMASEYETWLRTQPEARWGAICAASRARRARLEEWVAIEARSCAEGADRLREWLAGGAVSKVESRGSGPAAHVDLPRYPFQRKRYWIERARPRTAMRGRQREVIYETTFAPADPGWLDGHVVSGAVTLPGAAFIEMALAASGSAALSDVEFVQPVIVNGPVTLRTRVAGESWEISGDDGVCARGKVASAGAVDSAPLDIAGEDQAELLYGRAAASGVEYSGAMRSVRAWRAEGNHASARVELPADVAASEYTVHPALLDACWQVAGALLAESGTWAPAAVGRISVYRPGVRSGRCDAEVVNGAASARLWDDDGTLALAIDGLCFRRLRGRDWLYEPVWVEQPLTAAAIAASVTTQAVSVEGLRQRTDRACAMFASRVNGNVPERYAPLMKRLRALPRADGEAVAYCREQAAADPEFAGQWRLIERCGSALPAVLRGEVDPLEVVFGGAEEVYRESPVSRALNQMLAEAARLCGASRVLEIGAGTGASTPRLDAEYWFTDVSPTLIERARQRFPEARFATLDIAHDPVAQGFDAASFDLVIAAHVLHATPDLRETLRHVRKLLRPGGRLLLLETVEPQAWLDLTFGLTPGWWSGTDRELRGGYPLLSASAWIDVLAGAGFDAAATIGAGGTALIVAEARTIPDEWDAIGPADLRRELEAHGLRIRARAKSAVDLRALASNDVIDLCHGAMEIAAGGLRRLVFLTRDDAAGSALRALAQTIRLEVPETRISCIVLDDAWDAVVEELLRQAPEDRVALRGGKRFVERLRKLEPRTPGATWSRVAQEPGRGEVAIEVVAAGLNFRDALRDAGVYPAAAGEPGGECSGIVRAVGAGVEGISVGDEVIAAAEGSLASHVCARADLVVRRPANVPALAAAGIPIAWLSADYALQDLRAGQTVLIHAATGGVGLAALELARAAGATIVATAGSEEKRAYLRSRGVERVYDSRSTAFRELRNVDAVVNCLGGDAIAAGFDVLAPGGRFVELGRIGIWRAETAREYRADVRYEVIALDETLARRPAEAGERLSRLVARIAARELQLPPLHIFPACELSQAYDFMRRARHIGKIVVRAPQRRFTARPDATYLITGGTDGLGLRTAKWLTERGARHVVLAARRARDVGYRTIVCDTRDAESVRAMLREIDATMPPLAGVIHAAGILRDHAFAGFPADAFEDVVRTKVVGAQVLDEELAGRPLDFFVCYSSAGALLGSAGQANHVAANGYLDGLCRARRRAGRPALTVNWGAWSEIGSAAGEDLAARLAQRGMRRIAPDAGIATLESMLCDEVVQAAALPADWATYFRTEPSPSRLVETLRPARAASKPSPAPAEKPANLREQFEAVAEEQRRQFLVAAVCAEAARVLGARAPMPDEPLGDAGLDSLMAIELRARLAAATALSLPVTLQFNYPTAAAIADYLLSQLQPAAENDEAMLADMLERELREIETI